MIDKWKFGTHTKGHPVSAYRLTSETGLQAVVLDHGVILQSLYLPNGRNLCLGFETWAEYEKDEGYVGRIIGPNANRIANARYRLNGDEIQLIANDGVNNLHSGPNGFDIQFWEAKASDTGLSLNLKTPHGFHGFPSEIEASLHITLDQYKLRLHMQAKSSHTMPMNMTWHPYWNLSDQGRIDAHDLRIDSESRTQLDRPSPFAVKNTLYDFRKALPLGSIQLDTNYQNPKSAQLCFGKTVMTVTSSLPDMQVYTGDALKNPRAGIALEPQFRPNDINMTQDCVLPAGEIYDHWIEYSFETV